MSYRSTLKAALIGVALVATLLVAGSSVSAQTAGFDFTPLASSATATNTPDAAAPWVIPEGFTQTLVSGETSARCGGAGLNIYGGGLDDRDDMNTVNETGDDAGRYLYRTHEVVLRSGVTPDAVYPDGGAVSVIDLETCEARVIAQDPTYTALDGITWTPWGTILFAEEAAGGRLFELTLDPADPMSGTVVDHPAVGRLAHEGIKIDAAGAVYVIDEYRGQTSGGGGGIYKFVPTTVGDLSAGDLFVLGVNGDITTGEGVGQGQWIGPIDPATARAAGTAAGGTSYQRPEDLEIIDNVLYAAITEGTRDAAGAETYDGRVLAIDLATLMVTDYVKPGANAPVETATDTGVDGPDNLAAGPDGKLWIVEDNVPSDIWVAQPGAAGVAAGVELFASLTDDAAEGSGIYFPPTDPMKLYVNVQHSGFDDGDGTWVIKPVEMCARKIVDVDLWAGQMPTMGDDVILGTHDSDVIDALDGDDTICALGGRDHIMGGPGSDLIYAGGGHDVVHGGADNDTMYGQPGADEMRGGGGDDRMFGGVGFDSMYGDRGSDFIQGSGGDDTLYGGDGDDNLYGKAGADVMYGGDGNDELYAAGGDDEGWGGAGADRIQGAAGADVLDGGADDDTLYGQAGADELRGGAGADELYAAAGNDLVEGGPGNDELQGGAGNDDLSGDSGNDVLYGQAGDDDLDGGLGVDDCIAGPGTNTEVNC